MKNNLINRFIWFLIILILQILIFPGVLLSKDIAPKKPDIFLPSVVLEIEDLSVKSIVAPLPEEEILTPDVNFPLPTKEDLEISENAVNIEPMPSGIESTITHGKGKLRTNTTLGLGTLNNFYSYISLYSFATNPEAKLVYKHETADGFSGKPSSVGYSIRTDNVHAGINYKTKKLKIEGDSNFDEVERGLQKRSNYYSKINRFINLNANLTYMINDRFTLFGSLDNSFDSQRLTGGSIPYNGLVEYYVSPVVKAEYQFGKGLFGMKGYFGYRGVSGADLFSLSRVSLGGYVNYDISEKNSVKAGINGYWNSNEIKYVPFYIGIQSTVNDFLSISAEGGYRLTPNNLYNIFTNFPYIDIPNSLSDSTAWYMNGGAMWIASEKWVFTSKIEFSRFFKKPGFTSDLNSNGLFDLNEYSGDMIIGNIGARWIINDILSSRFRIAALFGDVPPNMNSFETTINLDGISRSGNFGGGAELGYSINKINPKQIPVFNMSAFYRVNDYFSFSLEAKDIFQPIFNSTRYSFYPYLDRGFFITIKTSVNF